MAEAKARLASLFQGGGGGGAQNPLGNDALRYTAPKEPSRSSQSQAQPTQQAATATATSANAVVFHTTVSLYQYDASARKYVQMGTQASNIVGCVLVGSEVTYSVLFYGSDKVPLCEIPFPQWKPTVQPKNYMNFYDEKGTNWSIKFASDDALVEFMRQVFLVKIHIEIWSPNRSVDANALLVQELGVSAIKNTGKDSDTNTNPVGPGDTVGVSFQCWRVVGNAKASPSDIITKYAPFEKTNGENDLKKFRIGDGSERIKALEEAVVGMKRGGKRMVLAPPGKTNGQEWYLIDVTLVKTKSGSGSSSNKTESGDQQQQRRASANAAAAAATAPSASSSGEQRKSRRKTVAASQNSHASNGDLVPYDDDLAQAKDELELKELRLRQREKQLEMQERAFVEGNPNPARHASMNMINGGGMPSMAQSMAQQQQQHAQSVYGAAAAYGGSNGGAYSPFGSSLFAPPMQSQGMMMSATGRPLDGIMMELHAKVDYLIRMAPAAGGAGGAGGGFAGSSFGGAVGATDVQSVMRGVERLAGENERLLLQINSQNQQYSAYEKRCDELLKQNQRIQEEKRVADEKYQSMASLQLNYNAEISSLTSARDAAITQTNRLHNEYQQLLTAFYQKQQVTTENEEQKNALDFERQARVRAEKELQKESQTKSLVDQELTLVKKQLEVFTKMKESELMNHRHEMEKQLQAAKGLQQQAMEDRIKALTVESQDKEKRLWQEWQTQFANQATQIEDLQTRMGRLSAEKTAMASELDAALARVRELEVNAETSIDGGAAGLAEEEKRIYTTQLELLHEQVKELEQEKFALVQQTLNNGDAADTNTHAAAAQDLLDAAVTKEQAAERTLAMAEEIKREAQEMMMGKNGAGGQSQDEPNGDGARQETMMLFKEAVNEMFFRFQDVFEDPAYAETALEGKQVLSVIRKVLKQSTKDVIQRQQDTGDERTVNPAASAVAASVVAAVPQAAPVTLPAVVEVAQVSQEMEDEGGDDSSDEPPPPPDMDVAAPVGDEEQGEHEKEEKDKPIAQRPTDNRNDEGVDPPKDIKDAEDEQAADEDADDDDAGADDLLFGAASVTRSSSSAPATVAPRRTNESEESEDDFED